jgi:hypothetical protein
MDTRKYKMFEDWFNEIEGYGSRSERAYDQSFEYVEDGLLKAHNIYLCKWLRAAFEAGREYDNTKI